MLEQGKHGHADQGRLVFVLASEEGRRGGKPTTAHGDPALEAYLVRAGLDALRAALVGKTHVFHLRAGDEGRIVVVNIAPVEREGAVLGCK